MPGATVAAIATFLPCYLMTVIPAPYFKKYGKRPGLVAFVDGVTAAAIGAIAGAVVVLDLPTEKLDRWSSREGLSELESDQVRHLTNVWVKAFREYEGRVADKVDGLIDEAEALPEGSDERHANALEIHKSYSAKVARQKDLVKRIRKLVKLRGEWPESHPDEL